MGASVDLKALQVWLNLQGASPRLAIDGLPGPATRRAIIETFRNRTAPAITRGGLRLIAERLGASVRQVAAVSQVEAPRGGWDSGGLLACLWERHYLFKRIAFAVPLLSDPRPGGYTIDADGDGINDSWEKLADATLRFGAEAAFECASFGKFQIMGAHWKKLGYASAVDFVWELSRGEAAHYEAFARYLETFGLVGALRAVNGNPENARAIAKGYNGPAYWKEGYHEKIAAAWRQWA